MYYNEVKRRPAGYIYYICPVAASTQSVFNEVILDKLCNIIYVLVVSDMEETNGPIPMATGPPLSPQQWQDNSSLYYIKGSHAIKKVGGKFSVVIYRILESRELFVFRGSLPQVYTTGVVLPHTGVVFY